MQVAGVTDVSFPFSRRGDRTSERANESAWGEQKKNGEKRERVGRKGFIFLPHSLRLLLIFRTRSQLRSLRVLLEINACYVGYRACKVLPIEENPSPQSKPTPTERFALLAFISFHFNNNSHSFVPPTFVACSLLNMEFK